MQSPDQQKNPTKERVRNHAFQPSPDESLAAERTLFAARVFLGVSLSIFLHVLVSVVTWRLSDFAEERPLERTALLEWIEPSELNPSSWKAENQVVRKADLPKDLLALNVKPVRRFLSEDRQTVKEETRARATGLTENRNENLALSESRPAARPSASSDQAAASEASKNQATKKPAGKSASRERLPEIIPNSIFEEGLGDVLRAPREKASSTAAVSENSPQKLSETSKELILPSDPRRNRGISTTGERLPDDVQIGDFTALNTDRFIFYTYYARIEEQIRHRWVRYVRAAIFGGGDLPEGARDFMTNLEIVLDREGEFIRAIVHEGSGSKDVDAAPILAFREARRIPHPPREMVKDDGTIRLFYSFHVDQLPPMARVKAPARPAGETDSDTGSESRTE